MTTIYMWIDEIHPTIHLLDSISPSAQRWAMEWLIEDANFPPEVLFEIEEDQ